MNHIKSLVNSFKHAIDGFVHCVQYERNMRIHLLAAFTVVMIAPYFYLSKTQVAILLLVIGLVIVCECFNTALEIVMNRITEQFDPMVKLGKDIAAAAVFLASLVAVGIGLIFFGNLQLIENFFVTIMKNPWAILFFSIYVPVGLWFVFLWPTSKSKKK